MKLHLTENPVVTLLCCFTDKSPDDFRWGDGPEVRISSKPEVWKKFYLPYQAWNAWSQYHRWGKVYTREIEIEPEWLYYTDWSRKGLCFPFMKKQYQTANHNFSTKTSK